MTLARGFAFYSEAAPQATSVRRVLSGIFGLEAARIAAILSDPGRRVLIRVDEAGALAGFVVFHDYKPQLLAPYNAFVSEDDKRLFALESFAAYSFEQVWFRGGDYPVERIVQELFDVMSDVLASEATRHALLCLLNEGEATLVPLLERQGFKARPNVYRDFRLELGRLPAAIVDATRGTAADLDVRTFAEPPDFTALADTFNRVFAGGRQELDAQVVQAIVESPLFSRELSLWIPFGTGVGAFAWVHRPNSQTADFQLVGTDPACRRQGLVSRAVPLFFLACKRASVQTLTFSIETHNALPLAMAEALGIAPYQLRRLHLRVR